MAPAQHELAPIFTNANRAIDENLLTMEKMRLLASHHGLVCLQHEKPFEGINGSGKHNNWSLSAGKTNLLEPGESPMDNLRFLVFLTGVIQAVDDYQELLRMSVASAGNDHRLGADEAPPAIVSIFLGDELGAIVDALVDEHEYTSAEKVAMDLGVAVLPNFLKDNTDRNRTSPFAFTGNKFEFRMPGSAVNLSDCNMILNTAMAKSLKDFADAMEGLAGRGIRGGRHRLHQGNPQKAPADHLQRQRLFRRVAASRPSAGGSRTTAPRPTRCPASSPRRASRCSRSSACSPSRK